MMTLRNDFHHTSTTVRVPQDGVLSARVIARVRRALCCSDCTCSDETGVRGPQDPGIEDLWYRDADGHLIPFRGGF